MCCIITITILIGKDMFKPSYKDSDVGKDWRKEEKGMTGEEMVEWHHWLKGREFEQAPGGGEGQGSLLQSTGSQRIGRDWVTEQ